MSEETTTIITPTPTDPTKPAAPKKKLLVGGAAGALAAIATAAAVFWPKGGEEAKPTDNPNPLVLIYSVLATNWSTNVVAFHDPRLPVVAVSLTNVNGQAVPITTSNYLNMAIRQATIFRSTLLGFKRSDGGILPVAEARIVAGSINQTNGVDATVLTEFRQQ